MRRPPDHSDAPVAELDEMACRGQAPAPVGRTHRRHVRQGIADRVHYDEGDLPATQLRPLGAAQVREDQNHPDRAPGQYGVRPRLVRCLEVDALGQHDANTLVARHAFDAADHLDRPWTLQLVEQQVDKGCARLLSGAAAAVAPLADQPLHPVPRVG